MIRNNLAIIIPAYKTTYLHETLQSLSNQTCKKFTLYIGDDASPNNIYEIVKEFENEIDIIYKRFDENLGGTNLVDQWNRCIDMTINEDWIWLFSDDDIMEPNCVELFYKHIESDKEVQLLHFNTDIIDAEGKLHAKQKPFPLKMTSGDFFEKRIGGRIFSFAVEYVFTRKLYIAEERFQIFDLAWCSDDATWTKFAKNNGITTIDTNALVHWRYSGENISSLNVDLSILYRKLDAKVAYLKWAIDFFKNTKTAINVGHVNKVKWILSDLNEVSYLTFSKRIQIAYKYANITGTFINGILGVLYICYNESKYWNKKSL
jgi:glycosyltransferase involved in cell wall biosynthesis